MYFSDLPQLFCKELQSSCLQKAKFKGMFYSSMLRIPPVLYTIAKFFLKKRTTRSNRKRAPKIGNPSTTTRSKFITRNTVCLTGEGESLALGSTIGPVGGDDGSKGDRQRCLIPKYQLYFSP
ncbi:hypothetical protein HKD37_10G029732 [Glycine soja]|nr:hypothetical protein GmHk_10G030271 [Glycine max]